MPQQEKVIENEKTENGMSPEEMEIENARKSVEDAESKYKELKKKIDETIEALHNNSEDINVKKKKLRDLEQQQFYAENYKLYLGIFTNEISSFTEGLQEEHGMSPNSRSLARALEDFELFKQVCAKKNSADFLTLSDKVTSLNVLIKEKKVIENN